MAETQLEQKEFEDKTKMYGENDVLPDLNAENVVSKELFQTEMTVQIQKVYMNKFGKPTLQIVSEESELTGALTINNFVYMQLKEKFGDKPKDWKGQEIILKAEWFEKGELKGWKLVLLN